MTRRSADVGSVLDARAFRVHLDSSRRWPFAKGLPFNTRERKVVHMGGHHVSGSPPGGTIIGRHRKIRERDLAPDVPDDSSRTTNCSVLVWEALRRPKLLNDILGRFTFDLFPKLHFE